MRYHLYYIISGIFIILLAMITIIFDWGNKPVSDRTLQMFPYFSDVKSKIDKIDIRMPNTTVTLVKIKNNWFILSADSFPADSEVVNGLFHAIENLQLVRSKTQITKFFPRLHLLNPSLKQKIDGEGTRIIFSIGQDQPCADFIIGDILKSYHNKNYIRLFTRYANQGGAYLAQTKTDFNFHPSQFLSSQFGMPKTDEILSIRLEKNDIAILNLSQVDLKNESANKKISFMPPAIPNGKKLIYPDVLTDYVSALTTRLRPIDALTIPLNKDAPQVTMIFEMTRARIAKIYFWKTKEASFMRIIRDDISSPHNYYVYQIENSDYETFVQPLDKFLVSELAVNS